MLRCTPESHAWAVGLADHCSLSLTDLVWQSLIRQAEASGYTHRVPTRYRPRRRHPNRVDPRERDGDGRLLSRTYRDLPRPG